MVLVSILFGLIGLSIVIFVHELGHFFFARLAGVQVEALSLGWGPKLLAFKRGNTSYRLSVLPIGGYCKMKGEDSYRKAIEENLTEFPREPGDYFAASPLKRIMISLGGPLFNLIFAFIVFFAISAIGYSVETAGNKIIIASDFDKTMLSSPAKQAGLKTGDEILAINGKDISSFYQIQEAVSRSAEKQLVFKVRRDVSTIDISIKPYRDKDTTGGKIGIFPWIPAIIGKVDKNGPAFLAGLKPGDKILSLNAVPLTHSIDAAYYLSSDKSKKIEVEYERNGTARVLSLIPNLSDSKSPDMGISWRYETHKIKSDNFFSAFMDGGNETLSTISGTFQGLVSLFQGVNVLSAVSGPARITWTVGQVTSLGFEMGVQNGLSYLFSFLAMLSIGLFIMNLLPIPVLDGGWIMLFFIELLRRKPADVKAVFRYQIIGTIAVASLFLLTTISDIKFFAGK